MKSWLIKVLNGPNAGAQILVPKEVVVGTSLECDLILNDPHISSLHCQIKQGEDDGFEVFPKEGIAYINGKKIETEKGKMLLGDVLTLGSTHLAGGPSEQLWPSITIPEIQEIGGVWQPMEPSLSAEELDGENQKKKQEKISKSSLHIIIIIGVCAFFGFFLFRVVVRRNLIVKRSEFRPAALEKEEEAPKKEKQIGAEAVIALQKKIPKSYIKGVERNGEYIIYIYVKNQIQYDEARKAMNAEKISIPSSIINIDDIDDSARAMMKAFNYSVDVRVDNRGKATWYGYLPNHQSLDFIKIQIGKDIPAITEDEYHIVLGEDAVKVVRDILLKNQFSMIASSPERDNITLTGTIFLADRARWKKTLKELESEFLGGVKFVSMVTINTALPKSHGFLHSPIVSVSISSTPYAVLENGDHIFVGAQVNDGYVVDSITSEGIGITSSEGKKFISLDGR